MNRYYEMTIEIDDTTEEEEPKIQKLIEQHWEVDDSWNNDNFCTNGRSWLTGGETESEFADRVSVEIWKLLGRYVEINVSATCLEDLPCEDHPRTEEDYKRLMGKEA